MSGHNKTLAVEKEKLERYNYLMSLDSLDYNEHGIPRYATVESWTVDFGGGYEADLKVCSSSDGDPLWCEAVLFFHGCECSCTDVEDSLDGTWELFHDGEKFTIEVSAV
ncbi:MAG: hypothetical protein NC311_10065 [Muribaculaceae bacterium]|nr:hypothetical protein [Muribaculaceae bacterium]